MAAVALGDSLGASGTRRRRREPFTEPPAREASLPENSRGYRGRSSIPLRDETGEWGQSLETTKQAAFRDPRAVTDLHGSGGSSGSGTSPLRSTSAAENKAYMREKHFHLGDDVGPELLKSTTQLSFKETGPVERYHVDKNRRNHSSWYTSEADVQEWRRDVDKSTTRLDFGARRSSSPAKRQMGARFHRATHFELGNSATTTESTTHAHFTPPEGVQYERKAKDYRTYALQPLEEHVNEWRQCLTRETRATSNSPTRLPPIIPPRKPLQLGSEPSGPMYSEAHDQFRRFVYR